VALVKKEAAWAKKVERQRRIAKRHGRMPPKSRALNRFFRTVQERTRAIQAAREASLHQLAPAPGDEALVSNWMSLRDQATAAGAAVAQEFSNFQTVFSGAHSPRDFRRREKEFEARVKALIAQQNALADQANQLGTELAATSCAVGRYWFVTIGNSGHSKEKPRIRAANPA
jgi:hypothetical protein